KHGAKKDQHQVQVQGRKDLADVRKAERAGEKYEGAVNQLSAEDELCRGRGEPARGALIRIALGATIEATCHLRKHTAMSGLVFRWSSGKRVDELLILLLVLPFCQGDRNAHAAARLHAFDKTIHA